MSVKAILFRLISITIGLAVAMFSGEILIRLTGNPFEAMLFNFYDRDTVGNIRMLPGERRHLSDSWDVPVYINTAGWRDTEKLYDDSREKFTVIAIGDSFTFGWGVAAERTFFSLIEAHFARDENIQFFNLGVPGTGPGDHLKLLRTSGAKLNPDLVIYSLFVGNDFNDVYEGGGERFDVLNGMLIPKEKSLGLGGRLEIFLKTRSALAQFLAINYWKLRDVGFLPGTTSEEMVESTKKYLRIHEANLSREFQQAVEQTMQYLQQIADYCRKNEMTLLIQVIPRSWQVYRSDYDEIKRIFHVSEQELDMDRAQRLISQWVGTKENRSIKVADMLPFLKESYRQGLERAYFSPNAHWNAIGHKASFIRLVPEIEEIYEKYRVERL